MLNIVVPMAGKGSRFVKEGYILPKPLIDVRGKHMIEVVINNLKPKCKHQFIFICQNEHIEKFELGKIFKNVCKDFKIVGVEGVTDGAAVSVLKSREIIDCDFPLMIANSDQWIDTDINGYLSDMKNRQLDGSILTMKSNDPKWSYAKVGQDNLVSEVLEKVVVSDEATVGIYSFSKGSDFCKYADYMVHNNIRSNGEFYVAPVYSFLAKDGAKIGVLNIGSDGKGMHGLGTPADLKLFLESDVSSKAIDF